MYSVDVIVQTLTGGLLMGAVYALIAIGFTLVFGVMDVVNFAHGHFVMLGMFAAFLLFKLLGIDPYASALLIVPVAFGVGVSVYHVAVRRLIAQHQHAHIVGTIAIFIIIENTANLLFGGDLRGITTSYTSSSVAIGTLEVPLARALAAAVSVAAIVVFTVFLKRSSFGLAIRAAASNQVGAKVVGVDVQSVYRSAFAISIAMAALAGTVIMPFSLVSPFVSQDFMLKSFVIAVLGGLGSVPGALLASLLVGIVEAFAGLYLSASLGNALLFSLLIVTLVLRPSGLLGGGRT